MSKNRRRQAFAAMSRGQRRRYQMTQPPNTPMPELLKLLGELHTREQNVITLNLIEDFLSQVNAVGAQKVKDLARAIQWAEGVRAGEQVRVEEIKGQLPKKDAEIPVGPEQPAAPEPAAHAQVGQVELEKGSPVLGMV